MGYKEINKLFAESAGRCNFPKCRELLFHEYSDKTYVNLGEICHIIGESSEGPRGHPKLSELLKKDEKNFILLCSKHHKIIDGNPTHYSVEKLIKMKEDHKNYVNSRLDISKDTNWTLILHSGNTNGIGLTKIDEELIFKDFIGNFIINNIARVETPEFLIETNNWLKFKNIQEEWWVDYQNQNDKPIKFIICSINYIPLVIHLGYLLHDTTSTEIFQFNRVENSWKWQKTNTTKIFSNIFKIKNDIENETEIKKLALAFVISGEINNEDLIEAVGFNIEIIKIGVKKPNRNWLQFKEQLKEFQKFFIEFIDDLVNRYKNLNEIHLFFSGPTPIAFIIGKTINPNIHPKFILYNYHKKNKPKYSKTITIND